MVDCSRYQRSAKLHHDFIARGEILVPSGRVRCGGLKIIKNCLLTHRVFVSSILPHFVRSVSRVRWFTPLVWRSYCYRTTPQHHGFGHQTGGYSRGLYIASTDFVLSSPKPHRTRRASSWSMPSSTYGWHGTTETATLSSPSPLRHVPAPLSREGVGTYVDHRCASSCAHPRYVCALSSRCPSKPRTPQQRGRV